MTRIDWIILKRIGSRIGLTVVIFFGLMILVESLDGYRFSHLAARGGVPLAVLGIVASAAKWLIRTLSITVLIGAIVGILDLNGRRELTVIKASGSSIWRILRAPVAGLVVFGLLVSFGAEDITTRINRSLVPTDPGVNSSVMASGQFWLEQNANGSRYVLTAQHQTALGISLQDVTVYLTQGAGGSRIRAASAQLIAGAWHFANATRYSAHKSPTQLAGFSLPTSTTAADLRLKLSSTDDMTVYELASSLAGHLTDPVVRSAVTTRFLRLLTLPALLVGSLLIAFAFTGGYRRSNGYGFGILYGIIVGFVIFVITEMADRAGSAGVLDPMLAAFGPALVAIVVGLTVLLYREDGRA